MIGAVANRVRLVFQLLCLHRLRAMGWSPRIGLDEGVRGLYTWFLAHGGDR